MKNKKIYFVILIILILAAFLIYLTESTNSSFNTPDENILKLFSENYANNGTFSLPLTSVSNLTRPRGTEVYNNQIIPLKFLGFIFFFGTFNIFNLTFYLTIISAILIIIFSFLLSREIFKNSRTSIISACLILFFPFFWYWSIHAYMENIAGILFFIIGYYYLVKLFNSQNEIIYYFLSAIFFAVSFFFRYDLIILAICFTLPYYKKFKTLNWKYLIYALILFLLFFIPSLILNKSLYGSYFLYGDAFIKAHYTVIQIFSFGNITSYFSAVFSYIPLLLLFILVVFNKKFYKKENSRNLLIGTIIYTIIYSLLIISRNPLTQPNILHESYTRYILLAYLFMIIFISSYLNYFKNKNKIFIIFCILLIFVLLSSPFIAQKISIEKSNLMQSQKIYLAVPKNSLLIVDWSDKFLNNFSSIGTISIENFQNETRGVNYQKFGLTIKDLTKDNNVLIWFNDFDATKQNLINETLKDNGMSLTPLNDSLQIYKIISISTSQQNT